MSDQQLNAPASSLNRRRVIGTAVWAAPAISVISAAPAFAYATPGLISGVIPTSTTGITYGSAGYHRWYGTSETDSGAHVPGTWSGTITSSKLLTVSVPMPADLPTTKTLSIVVRLRDTHGNLTRPALFGGANYASGNWVFASAEFHSTVPSSSDHAVDFTFTHKPGTTPGTLIASFIGVKIISDPGSNPQPSVDASQIATANYWSATISWPT